MWHALVRIQWNVRHLWELSLVLWQRVVSGVFSHCDIENVLAWKLSPFATSLYLVINIIALELNLDKCFSCFLSLQRYLEKFRVAELKELLRRVGVPQRGRKMDLLCRANEVMRGSVSIQREIQNIYEREHFVRKPMKMTESYSKRGLAHHRHQHDLHQPDIKSLSSKYPTPSFVLKEPVPFVMHPDVTFKLHPFYQVMECIIRPTALGKRLLCQWQVSGQKQIFTWLCE